MIEILILILLCFVIGFMMGYSEGLHVIIFIFAILLTIYNASQGEYDSDTAFWTLNTLFHLIVGCIAMSFGYIIGKILGDE